MAKLMPVILAAGDHEEVVSLVELLMNLVAAGRAQNDPHSLDVNFGKLLVDGMDAIPDAEASTLTSIYNDVAKNAERRDNWDEAERVYHH